MAYKKSDITFHRESFRDGRPAVNVKCRNFGGRDVVERLQVAFQEPEAKCQKAFEMAWDSAVESFWDFLAIHLANEILAPAFPSGVARPLTCYGEGRSSGWLIVEYEAVDGLQGSVNQLPPVEDWDAIQVSAWGRFEKAIHDEIAYQSEYDTIRENIEANEWLIPLAERAARVVVEMAD